VRWRVGIDEGLKFSISTGRDRLQEGSRVLWGRAVGLEVFAQGFEMYSAHLLWPTDEARNHWRRGGV